MALIERLRTTCRLLWEYKVVPWLYGTEPNLRCMVCGGRHRVNDCSVDVGDL
jgi:hypothetical protein